MRVLVGKTFGIGNAFLSIPMIKAIMMAGHEVDILVGDGPDDKGALEVMLHFMENHSVSPRSLYVNVVPEEVEHDYAVMAIPFDGRWQNGVHFRAKYVLDGRTRPMNIERLGFDMWEKHEVEYQMENAELLGFAGPTPSGEIEEKVRDPYDADLIYLGIGFKRDPGGFGRSKHFGNERYYQLIREIRKIRPLVRFTSTCGPQDWIDVAHPLRKRCFEHAPTRTAYTAQITSVKEALRIIKRCAAYLGNDTGMMHAAASLGLPTFGLFSDKYLLVKNPPYTERGHALLFVPDCPPIEKIAEDFVQFVWG